MSHQSGHDNRKIRRSREMKPPPLYTGQFCIISGCRFWHPKVLRPVPADPGIYPVHQTMTACALFRPATSFDCGGKCDIRTFIKDGKAIRNHNPVRDAELNEEMPIMRACVRARLPEIYFIT